jgi:WD40 repeat protein
MRYAEIARTLVVNLDAGRLHRLKAEWLAHGGRVRCVDFVWLLSRSATLGSDAHRWSDTEILGGMMRCWAELSHAEDGTVSWEVFSAFLAHTSTSLTQSIHRNEEVRIYRPAEPPTMDLSRELLRASAREPTHAQQTRKLGEGAVHISVLKMLFLGAPLDRYLLCERHGSTLHLRLYAPTPHGLPYSRELESAPFVLTDAAVVPEHSLLAGSYSGAWVQLWDTARNYAPIRRIGDAGLRTAIICLAWCRQSGYLVGGTASGSLAFFNAGANWAMREGAQSASGASITVLLRVQVPSVELIISGSLSGELRVCDVERAAQSERGGQRNVLIGHVGSISSLAYSEAHHYLISAGLDRCVFVWNLFAAHGVPVAKLNLSAAIIQLALPAGEMARGQGGRVVVAGDAQGRFRVISLRSLQVVQEFSAFVDDVEPLRGVGSLASGPAAARAAAGGRGGGGGASIDDEDGSRMVGFALDTAITDRLVLAPSRGALLRIMAPIGLRQPTPPVAGVVAGVSVQSLRASAALLDADSTLDGLSDARSILSVCLVQETQMVITVTETGVRTWEALTGAPIREYLDLSSEGLTAFCADGSRRFWIGCHDGRLREFSLLSGALQRECTPHSSEVVAIVLSARFRAIVTASWDGTVAITPNPTDGQPLATTESVRLRTHVHGDDETTAELSCVALSDDEELAAAGAQGAVYVWNMQHARREAVLVGPHAESEVTTVVFARRARCLFSADSRGFVAGWNLADGPHKYTAAIVINQSQRPEPALPVGTGPAAVRRRAHLDVSAAAGALLGASRAPIAVQAAVWDHACSTLYTADDAGTIVGWELVVGRACASASRAHPLWRADAHVACRARPSAPRAPRLTAAPPSPICALACADADAPRLRKVWLARSELVVRSRGVGDHARARARPRRAACGGRRAGRRRCCGDGREAIDAGRRAPVAACALLRIGGGSRPALARPRGAR